MYVSWHVLLWKCWFTLMLIKLDRITIVRSRPTIVVEMCWFRSWKQYFLTRNYSTTTEATMITLTFYCKAISLLTNSRKSAVYLLRLLRYSTWTAGPKTAKFLLFSFHFIFFFVFFLNICVRCPSHNWSKTSSNRAEFFQTHRGVNIVSWDTYWVHSVMGFRRYRTSKLKNILKIFPCYSRHDLIFRDFLLNKWMYRANGRTDIYAISHINRIDRD